MKPEGSLPHSQKPAARPYTEPSRVTDFKDLKFTWQDKNFPLFKYKVYWLHTGQYRLKHIITYRLLQQQLT